jgi:type VI secretion system secreted protein VgrG
MGKFDDLLSTQKRFEFRVSTLDADTFAVVNLTGDESLSTPYWFELELISDRNDIDLDSVIGKPASLRIIAGQGGADAIYHGLVAGCAELRQIGSSLLYAVRLEPQVTALSYYSMSEVYLDKTLGGIIDDVFKTCGLSAMDYELRLIGDAASRTYPYACQYEESALNFVQRMAEAAGVYYYFEDDLASEKVVFLDATISQSTALRQVSYLPISGLDDDRTLADAVQRFTGATTPLPRTLMVRNYDYRRASVKIEYEATVSASGTGRVVIFGEPVGTVTEAQQVAEIRAQELSCRETVYEGASTAVGIRAGIGLQLQGYFRRDLNAKYLVTRVRHEGSQAGVLLAGLGGRQTGGQTESAVFYRNEFTALPWTVQYRPQQVTSQPRIAGTMSAFVDAEGSGQYAELDEQGRYKVQVPYDLSDKSAMKGSDWLRFAKPYAGPVEGLHFPLRKSTEVLLSYQNGDPDRPTMVGAVVNSQYDNVVTDKNETHDIVQTSGGNLLRMQDRENNQHLLMKAPKDESFIAFGDSGGAEQVESALAAGVGHRASTPRAITQYTEGNQLIKARGGLSVEVGPDAVSKAPPGAGNVQLTADQNLVENVSGYDQLNVGNPATPTTPAQGDLQINTSGNVIINAAGDCNITCGTTNQVDENIVTEINGKSFFLVGGGWTEYQKGVSHKLYYGEQILINMGMASTINIGMYNRVFIGGRASVFCLPRFDYVILLKTDIAFNKWELITGVKTEWKNSVAKARTINLKLRQITIDDTITAEVNNRMTSLQTAVSDVITHGAALNLAAQHITL